VIFPLNDRHANPLLRAQDALGPRLTADPRGPSGWRLDGRVARLSDIVGAANVLLVAWDCPPIVIPGGDA
jgi:hypothetical protein